MSTDDRYGFGRRLPDLPFLEHPLLGDRRRPTTIALAYLGVLVGLFALSYAGTTVTVGGSTLDTVTARFDTVSTYLIALATATIAIVPFVYAAWNGGPVLAAAMPLVPVALGDLAAGQYVLRTDTAIALTVAGSAAALALYATDVRRTGTLWPPRGAAIDTDRLLVVTVTVVVTAVGVGQFVAGAPPRSLEWYAPFSALWLVPTAVVGAYWVQTLRASVASRTDRERADSEP
ncbi:hypothetical protein [Natronolimnohabitans innermongolicus]|uniref:Uncharacterized protein n=1 Tax=Natronolimnohabitans innermongolicus JCM 12255 TaxID=1227499 RepID=L9X4W4_9EURY|nr:hypothetical protein [Natronolimnohabitans innermongolicus]ELY55623.1 hypothetical protein C493_10987 [Natronolimnohabitans innermongolicus JCM 12255]